VLPNAPFDIGRSIPPGEATGDLVHSFYNNQAQINGGAMNKFIAHTDAGALTLGYYDLSHARGGEPAYLWRYAQQYTLADHFFQAAFGGSFLNHQWLVAARTPEYPNAPDALASKPGEKERKLDVTGRYAINTINSAQAPIDPRYGDRLPAQTHATIGDRLSDGKISWAWYAGGWDAAQDGRVAAQNETLAQTIKQSPECQPVSGLLTAEEVAVRGLACDALIQREDHKLEFTTYQFHHNPLTYFANYDQGTVGRKEHLKDYDAMMAAIDANALEKVVFYKPLGKLNQHSGYSDILNADDHVKDVIDRLQKSSAWCDMAIIITYDEFGGYWDHVAPPQVDQWGPGPRIPALIISPLAKKGYVDPTVYDTTSILATVEHRFGLPPLTSRDAQANDLANAFCAPGSTERECVAPAAAPCRQ
jgi:phospholipase C